MAIQLPNGVNYTPSCICARTRRKPISQSARTGLFRRSRIASNKQECAGSLRTTLVFANDLIVPFDTAAQNVKATTQSTDVGLGDHLLPLPTPINIENLNECLIGYHQEEKHALLEGLTQGFRLCYSGPDRSRMSANHKSARDDISTLKMKIQKEVDAGRVAGDPDRDPDLDSRIYLRILHNVLIEQHMQSKYSTMTNVRYDENMRYAITCAS